MRKNKFYFGKKHLKHKEGIHKGRWVVPAMFHVFYATRLELRSIDFKLKMRINATCGVVFADGPEPEHYANMLLMRRKICKALNYNANVKRMRELIDEVEAPKPKVAA